MKKKAGKIFFTLVVIFVGLGFYSLSQVGKVEEIHRLKILTRYAPTTLYQVDGGYSGFEYDLAKDFVDYTGIDAEFIIKDSIDEILEAMRESEGGIAAAGLTKTEARVLEFDFSPSYYTVQEEIVCNKSKKYPKNLQNFKTELVVIKGSSYEEKLKNLKTTYPNLRYKTYSGISTEELLRLVYIQDIECTVADSNIVAINRQYYPSLKVAFSLPGSGELGWILDHDNIELQQKVEDWFINVESTGRLQAIANKYYSFRKKFAGVNIERFQKDIEKRLSVYIEDFQKAGRKHQIPWELLASIAYQESHWKKNAQSSSGVEGIMMLSSGMAKKLGVKNRLNPTQSIMGVAKHLSEIMKKLPKSIEKTDKIYFTLSAYNIGFSHLEDSIELAKKLKKNPNLWLSIRETLPLLSQKKYYKDLKYGYARGDGAVNFTKNISSYYDVLKKDIGE